MNQIGRDIFKSIIEKKWLFIEYENKNNDTTRYWICIKKVFPSERFLIVDGFNLMYNSDPQEYKIFYDSIKSTKIIEGTYYKGNEEFIKDIQDNPNRYTFIFKNKFNFRVLNYYAECNRLDSNLCQCDTSLITGIDHEELVKNDIYELSNEQFYSIVNNFQKKLEEEKNFKTVELCMNLLSIKIPNKGYYVLAHKRLYLDIHQKTLVPAQEVTFNKEFIIDGEVESIRKYLAEEDYHLLTDFYTNKETIADRIHEYNDGIYPVSDAPFIMTLEKPLILDLDYQYKGILDMYSESQVTEPIKAFFGEIKSRPIRKRNYPITLINDKINLDQLLAIHHTMKYPVTYVQGPPGTGKTNTIINTIITALFNDKTVLLTSYNNHPMDEVYDKLSKQTYHDRKIPFPMIRLGNREKVLEALNTMKYLADFTESIPVYEKKLDKTKYLTERETSALTTLLENYEERQDLLERKETIEKIISTNPTKMYTINLETKQLEDIKKRLEEIPETTNEKALELLQVDLNSLTMYLYYTSVRYIKRIHEPKNQDLLNIINTADDELKITEFNRYLSNDENMIKFLRIFPIVISTNISCHRLGLPKPYFDLTIIDEASQCNAAVALVPIIRGENLLLVGDPQQLKPVIVLDEITNQTLMKKHNVTEEFNYITQSIYHVYLSNDPISDEILLSYHYRSHKKIIQFNNAKYYNNKLKIMSTSNESEPLRFVDIPNSEYLKIRKNTSPSEADLVLDYVKKNRGKEIGIITPFVHQKDLINQLLSENGINDVVVGTVHAFQGDEKDIILLSTAITDVTSKGTYDWLKNNKELINVATSRAKEKIIVYSNRKKIQELNGMETNDFYDFIRYVETNGKSEVISQSPNNCRALGFKPYSTDTEADFLEILDHALNIINLNCTVKKEVPIKHVFWNNDEVNDLFYTGTFDFVVYMKYPNKKEYPIIVFELDGLEHKTDENVIARDRKKDEIATKHKIVFKRIDNTYARRYNFIKQILLNYLHK